MEAGGAGNETQQSSYQEPLERQRCEHTLIGGTRCRRWADRDEKMCHAHRMYAQSCGRSRVDVPLLEDDASILYVLSQAAQALARGAMPPSNGLAIIGACRQATRVLTLRVERGKLAARRAAAEQRAPEALPKAETREEPEKREGPDTREAPEAREEPEMQEEPEMAIEVAACEDAEGDGAEEYGFGENGSEKGGPDEAVEGNPFEEECAAAQARAADEKAERERRTGPWVELPRFRQQDLEEQWERGTERPFQRNENNTRRSPEEIQAMLRWQRAHPEIMKAQEQHLLDVYFGRAESTPDDPWMWS
ncbi:MAG TPA: hypothetical protein VJV22_16345 [Acidobacteriaceae bacterium]|nr:hypothetical protein [Acidobacteriaceae bacterium]